MGFIGKNLGLLAMPWVAPLALRWNSLSLRILLGSNATFAPNTNALVLKTGFNF
jgi:hypothetical protein